jgi:hypothetical protein
VISSLSRSIPAKGLKAEHSHVPERIREPALGSVDMLSLPDRERITRAEARRLSTRVIVGRGDATARDQAVRRMVAGPTLGS